MTLGHSLSSSLASGRDIHAHLFWGNYERVVAEISHLPGFYNVDGVVRCTGTKKSLWHRKEDKDFNCKKSDTNKTQTGLF
jgi:hypothetical protein